MRREAKRWWHQIFGRQQMFSTGGGRHWVLLVTTNRVNQQCSHSEGIDIDKNLAAISWCLQQRQWQQEHGSKPRW
eukprot:5148433-Ditylum_brightwellii.AAC.1